MNAGSALDRLPLRGFKDFYQYASTTRVIAGRDLLESTVLTQGAAEVARQMAALPPVADCVPVLAEIARG